MSTIPTDLPHTNDDPGLVCAVPARSQILGYIRLGPGDSDEQVDGMRRCLDDYARNENHTLLDVFIDMEASATSGFAALIDAVFRTQADTVVLPATHQFARLPGLHLAMKDLLERQTGANVIILESRDEDDERPRTHSQTRPSGRGGQTEPTDRAVSWADWQHRSSHLDKLSTALRPFGLLVRHGGSVPQLHVSDPRRSTNSEAVIVSRDTDGTWWYWWADAERIATIDDHEEAARRVAGVIRGIAE